MENEEIKPKSEKTVGEILEEEGIIKPTVEKTEERKPSFFEDVSLRKVVMDVEKLRAQVDGLKEVKFSSDERIKELAESIGELRSLVFQRDSMLKELQSKVKMIEEDVSDIKPGNIEKSFQKGEEKINEFEARTEKVERMNKDLIKDLSEAKSILESIKSVENLKENVKNMEDLTSKARETKGEIDRLAGKTEKFYSEIEGKMKEFYQIKSKLEKVDDLTKEITKSMDSVNIKLAGFASRDDMESFKKTVDGLLIASKEKLESRVKTLEDALNIPSEEIMNRINELEKRKQNILNLLNNLEEQHRRAVIKKETYEEVKEKNENLLNSIEDDIKKFEGQKGLTLRSLPTIINELEDSLKMMNERTTILESNLRQIKDFENKINTLETSITEPEKIARMMNAINEQADIINNILNKFSEVKTKLLETTEILSFYETRTRFFEVLNILVRVGTKEEISTYLNELENMISKMKTENLWNREKEDLTRNLLTELTENWQDCGNLDIATAYKNFLEKNQI